MVVIIAFFESIGDQKVGTTIASFLKNTVGSRYDVLFSGNSISNDAYSSYYNGGILGFIDKTQFSFYIKTYPSEIYQGFFAFNTKRKNFGFGGYINSMYSSYIQETDEDRPFGTGYYWNYNNIVLGLTGGTKLYDRFGIGFSFKFIQENIANYSYSGLALDIGSIYLIGYRDIRIGVGIYNLGPDIKGYALPIVFRLSVSGDIFRGVYLISQLEKSSDRFEIFSFALERAFSVISIRSGINSVGNYSFGLGIKLSKVYIDYGFLSKGHFGTLNSINIGYVRWRGF